jgi:general secretion pathway protein A
MDERHFRFTTEPFSLTLDSAFFFRSRQHLMAETVLEYALESGAAFCLLSGEIGCGKSLLASRLLSKLGDGIRVGLINHTHGRLRSIHGSVAFALGIEHNAEPDAEIYETLVTSFQREYAKGRRTLLIVDEAQNLSVEILEELRLLSNANSKKNLLQIFLVGQPELRARLSRPELQQFAQRISAQCHLSALTRDETHAYIRHRLNVAGGNPSLFSSDAMDLVHARTRGVPRLINQLCHFALAQASAAEQAQVYADTMAQMPRDFCGGLALQPNPLSGHTIKNRSQAPPGHLASGGCFELHFRRLRS